MIKHHVLKSTMLGLFIVGLFFVYENIGSFEYLGREILRPVSAVLGMPVASDDANIADPNNQSSVSPAYEEQNDIKNAFPINDIDDSDIRQIRT
jgi:hypothetical protein